MKIGFLGEVQGPGGGFKTRPYLLPPSPPNPQNYLVARASCPGQHGLEARATALRGWGREFAGGAGVSGTGVLTCGTPGPLPQEDLSDTEHFLEFLGVLGRVAGLVIVEITKYGLPLGDPG
jgi:hypothetical protein